MYDLEELKTFIDVMDSGSLTASARRLGVAKSTLSRRIAHLETQLSQPLLRRQANRLLPTEAGSLFLGYAREMLRIAEQSQLALDDLKAEISGGLVIKVHSALARSFMARQAELFLKRHPKASLEIRTLRSAPTLPDGSAIHLWVGTVAECGLRQETLGWITRGVYANPDYLLHRGTPSHPHELKNHAWVDLLGDTESGMTLDHPHHGRYHLPSADSRLRVDQLALHADAIARGQGVGLMPHWMAERRLQHHPDTLVQCLGEWQASPLPVTLLYPYGHQPRKIATLIDQLRQSIPADWQRDTVGMPAVDSPDSATAH
ncbi:LysR family transcriptional regulator [Salinicola socius]|uniref:LysR family transcriptional regulator n=1 Tax=Salinicola socius TaxID=404433 RepID=A0A1Q8SMZ5_9GAMM|nr:LysR family transcriptional regulator [Salinicola socius]OLO02829.1 LysR family transcriptional regulator [Salinicola socius]